MALALFLAGGCQRAGPSGPAAKAAAAHDESSLNQVVLSADQVESLLIKKEKPGNEKVQDRRRLNGWILAPQGHEVTLTASVAGYVGQPKDSQIPLVGYPVKKGQKLVTLDPVLTPLEKVQLAALKRTIDSDLTKAEENMKVAIAEVERIKDLHKQGLRSDQDLEIAKAKVAIAEEDRRAALDKQKLFDLAAGDKPAQLPLQLVEAPLAAHVLTVHVSPGQYVPAAAPLITLCDYTQLWVRVPVPEYDLPRVQDDVPALVEVPGATGGKLQVEAKRKATVPQVDPLRHTGDVIYELPVDAAAGHLAKDQMVGVLVPLGGQTEASVVKYSAVIFDAYGGSWIYLDRGADANGLHVYERRRVELGAALGDKVSIRPALQANDEVVVEGAAKLFSAEFFYPPKLKAK